MKPTIIKTANIRVALSHNYSTFEVSMQLENEEGVTVEQIAEARDNCQKLANEAVNDYKRSPHINAKEEVKKLEAKVAELKQFVEKKDEIEDPAEAARIAGLPLHPAAKKTSK